MSDLFYIDGDNEKTCVSKKTKDSNPKLVNSHEETKNNNDETSMNLAVDESNLPPPNEIVDQDPEASNVSDSLNVSIDNLLWNDGFLFFMSSI